MDDWPSGSCLGWPNLPKYTWFVRLKFQPAGLLKGFDCDNRSVGGSDFCDLLWVQLDNMSGYEAFGTLLCHLFLCDSTVETARFFGSESSWIRELLMQINDSVGRCLDFEAWVMTLIWYLNLEPSNPALSQVPWDLSYTSGLSFQVLPSCGFNWQLVHPKLPQLRKQQGACPNKVKVANGGEPVSFFLGWYLGTRFLVCRSYLDHVSFTQMASHNAFL